MALPFISDLASGLDTVLDHVEAAADYSACINSDSTLEELRYQAIVNETEAAIDGVEGVANIMEGIIRMQGGEGGRCPWAPAGAKPSSVTTYALRVLMYDSRSRRRDVKPIPGILDNAARVNVPHLLDSMSSGGQ
jgi:hypothetical protein